MRRKKRKSRSLLIVIFIALIAILSWWHHALSPLNSHDQSNVVFTVPKGSGIKAIATNLKEAHLIRNTFTFYILVKRLGLENKIQAGDFRLSPSESAAEIAKSLTKSSLDISITIPEGKRAQEIADILKNTLPTYDQSWRDILNQYEGYLFPDTYFVAKEATINQIVNVLKGNFEKHYADPVCVSPTDYTKDQVVIIASLIEREAGRDEDRPLVASVIENRLRQGMPLQLDATVQYMLGYNQTEKTWWKKNLTIDDLAIPSSYNTYTHQGLPPTPISNPGCLALKAATDPVKTNYLYYISDKTGHNHYATTLEQHNANIKKYGL